MSPRRRLTEFLSIAFQHQPAIEVYTCWDGDQGAPVECHRRVIGLMVENRFVSSL
jgi:hypothetical protein